MEEFLTADILVSLAGCIIVVTLLTQFVKGFFRSLDPKIVAAVLSFLVVLLRQFIWIQDYTVAGWSMYVINAVVCFASAVTAYETAVKPIKKSIEAKTNT